MNDSTLHETPEVDLSEDTQTKAKTRGRPKTKKLESQKHQQDGDVTPKATDMSHDIEKKAKKGKGEILKYKRIQIDTVLHNLILTTQFTIEKQRGNTVQHAEITDSCDGKTFRVLKTILIDNLASVFFLFWSLQDQELAHVRVFFSLSKNKVFSLNLLDLKKATGKKAQENDLKIALLDWFKSNSFFTRGNNSLLGVEILLNDAASRHLTAQNIPENYTLRTVYILSKKDIIETK